MEGTPSDDENDLLSSDEEGGEHSVENSMLLFCAFCVQSAPARFPKRRRAVQGGSDMSLRLGSDLSLSGLNAGAFCVSSWTCGRKSTAKRLSFHDASVSEHYQDKAKQG